MTGLYIHVPFCVRKCLYCDFYSLEPSRDPLSQRLRKPPPDQPAFMQALRREILRLPRDFAPDTLFIGGGTPTELSTADLATLLEGLPRWVNLSNLREWTCECNPGTLTVEKADLLARSGVTRVSLGVQSFHDPSLEYLGRIHTAQAAIEGFEQLRRVGIKDLNIDLMFGVPSIPFEVPLRDVEQAIALRPEHISMYCLTIEDGTPFADLERRGHLRQDPPGRHSRQYAALRRRLLRAGYEQYEISNFARPGHRCRHNELYWQGGSYLGCGPAAHSHWHGRRWGNAPHLARYVEALHQGPPPREGEEQLDPSARARELLVFGLRHLDGIDPDAFRRQTGETLETTGGNALRTHLREGRLHWHRGRLTLPPRSLFRSDALFADLI